MFPKNIGAPPRANRIASPKVLHAVLAPVAAGASFLDAVRDFSVYQKTLSKIALAESIKSGTSGAEFSVANNS
jgi:hypothetical protein